MDENIVLKDKERNLYLGMVDKEVKQLFTLMAEESHCNHYGNCLKWCIEQALEYQSVKEIILNKEFINNILGNKPEIEMNEEVQEITPKKQIRMLDGKTIEKEVNKNE